MADSRKRDVSSKRRSRNLRSASPVISFADRQSDAQARAVLEREAKKAAPPGDALSGDELPQGGATQPLLEPHESEPSPFPAKTAFLSFVAGKLREDKTLTTDYLLDQCFEHFNLDALGAAQDDFRPHIVAIHEEVTHSLAKQVKFAFGPEPAVIRTTAAPAPGPAAAETAAAEAGPRQQHPGHDHQGVRSGILPEPVGRRP